MIIAIANQKGGVGKTTTAGALIAGLSEQGYSVLGVDLDPQGNLSSSVGADMYNGATAYELLKQSTTPDQAIQKLEKYSIISSNIMLAGAEQELNSTGKEYRLKEALETVINDYDYIIIDTPPALSVLIANAFTIADEIIIPSTAGIFAVQGIKQLNDTINNIKKYCNPSLKIKGILVTRFDNRTNISKQIKELAEELSEYIKAPIFNTYIRNGIVVEEAQANAKDIFDYSSNSNVAQDYKNFIDEYLKGE